MLTPVNKQKRNCVRDLAPLVHVVNVERVKTVYFDVARELGDTIDALLALAPVKAALPSLDQTFYV